MDVAGQLWRKVLMAPETRRTLPARFASLWEWHIPGWAEPGASRAAVGSRDLGGMLDISSETWRG